MHPTPPSSAICTTSPTPPCNRPIKVLNSIVSTSSASLQPSISLDQNRAIINVELAGATDPDRVRKYLQSTANLQFWEVYNVGELATSLQNADKALQNYLNGVKADTTTPDTSDTAPHGQSCAAKKDTSSTAANQNPLFRLMPSYPASAGPQDGPAPLFLRPIARALLRDTGTVNSYLNNPIVRNNFPQDLKFLWGKQQTDDDGKPLPSWNSMRSGPFRDPKKPGSKDQSSRTPPRISIPSPARSLLK
jgi:SecD/SecF fusion protein